MILAFLANPLVASQTLTASYYANNFHGYKTASGEIYSRYRMTCAHLIFPFGTKLLVSNPKTGKSVVVRVNDRGPYHPKRQLDLSEGAFKRISDLSVGVIRVKVKVVAK